MSFKFYFRNYLNEVGLILQGKSVCQEQLENILVGDITILKCLEGERMNEIVNINSLAAIRQIAIAENQILSGKDPDKVYKGLFVGRISQEFRKNARTYLEKTISENSK